MMYSGYEMMWLFFVYSFLGWIFETVTAAVRQRRFVNRGLVNAPLCLIYGVSAVMVTLFCGELKGFWLFAGSVILTTVIEWSAGHLIEKLYQEKWWDYSGLWGNLDGYICAPASVLWGILSMVMMKWGNPCAIGIFERISPAPGKFIIWILMVILALDVTATLCILSGRSRNLRQWESVDSWLAGISFALERRIYGWVDQRIRRAYPDARYDRTAALEAKEKGAGIFAYGCCFYKILWILVIGSFLGDIVETIFCRVTAGVWMSRSSVVWGPFSLVWGIAMAGATILLYKYKDRSDRFLFLIGTCLGGAYEYVCSVFTEMVFGKVFWDYSHMAFNLGGRINLLYCFFWGIAAVIWIKGLYPRMSDRIEKIPMRTGKILSWFLLVFFCCNIAVSSMALLRSSQRAEGIPAESGWQEYMDTRFDDERMMRIYPNALQRGDGEHPAGERPAGELSGAGFLKGV